MGVIPHFEPHMLKDGLINWLLYSDLEPEREIKSKVGTKSFLTVASYGKPFVAISIDSIDNIYRYIDYL